jgi:glycosyltransferase involved in cell wall biosynthesis
MPKPTTPRVLIITPFFYPNLGGVETHLSKLTDYLSSHQYHTTVLTYKPLSIKVPYLKNESRDNLNIHRFWWFGLGLFDKTTPYPLLQFIYIVPGLLFSSLFYCLKNRNNFDVIHAHGFAAAFITRIINIFLPSKIIVVSTHFIYHRLNPKTVSTKLFRWVFNGFNTILAVSEQSRLELSKIGINPKKIKKFRYWIDQKEFIPKDKTKYRQILKIPKNYNLVVFFAGRFIKMKGIFNLLKVAQKSPADILFLLAGDGPDSNQLTNESAKVKNFRILGRLPHLMIVDYMAASDIVILPSLSEEALPNLVIEALSCGRPIITTDKGSVVEMYDTSVGIKINPTPDNILKSILFLYKNPKKIQLLSNNAKPYAIKHYSENNADIIIKSYYDQR